jgi:hypothetical protein
MHDDEREFDEREWTEDERAQLEMVGAHRSPRRELRERTVSALQSRRLVARRPPLSPRVWAALAAAAAIVFAIGTLVGYQAALRRVNASRIEATSVTPPPPQTREARLDSNNQPAPRKVVWF